MAKRRHTLRATTVLPALLVVAIIGTLGVIAQPGPRGFPRHEPGGEPRLEHALGTLNLTAEQQAAIDKIFTAKRGSDRADRESIMKVEIALRDQIHADTFDEQAIRQAAAAVAVLQADQAVAQAKMLNDVRAVLTADQRASLLQALKQPEGMWGRGGPRRPDDARE